MDNRSELLEEENAVFAAQKPCVCDSHSGHSQAAVITKQSEGDELLENTILNTVSCESLTKRETEILKFIVAGSTNKKIAEKLYRTERTVEYHRNRLMRKLGAHSAAEMVKRAIDSGLV